MQFAVLSNAAVCGFSSFWLSIFGKYTADRLAQLVEHQTAVREVAGSNLGRANTQGL